MTINKNKKLSPGSINVTSQNKNKKEKKVRNSSAEQGHVQIIKLNVNRWRQL
uniref:Uncharacterized protein n=1 Tax=Anguilla anguilla TaxID=7936 RepID=A0A0E9SRB7_ANGAN